MCVCLRACVCACVYVRVYLSPPPPTLSPSIRSRRWNLKWCELSGMELKMYVFNSPTGPAPALVGLDVDNAADDESRHGSLTLGQLRTVVCPRALSLSLSLSRSFSLSLSLSLFLFLRGG